MPQNVQTRIAKQSSQGFHLWAQFWFTTCIYGLISNLWKYRYFAGRYTERASIINPTTLKHLLCNTACYATQYLLETTTIYTDLQVSLLRDNETDKLLYLLDMPQHQVMAAYELPYRKRETGEKHQQPSLSFFYYFLWYAYALAPLQIYNPWEFGFEFFLGG